MLQFINSSLAPDLLDSLTIKETITLVSPQIEKFLCYCVLVVEIMQNIEVIHPISCKKRWKNRIKIRDSLIWIIGSSNFTCKNLGVYFLEPISEITRKLNVGEKGHPLCWWQWFLLQHRNFFKCHDRWRLSSSYLCWNSSSICCFILHPFTKPWYRLCSHNLCRDTTKIHNVPTKFRLQLYWFRICELWKKIIAEPLAWFSHLWGGTVQSI